MVEACHRPSAGPVSSAPTASWTSRSTTPTRAGPRSRSTPGRWSPPGGRATTSRGCSSSRAARVGRALQDYRVLLLDQRGTGRSTVANRQTLPADPAEAARRLRHFRADSIVRDAELLRRALAGDRPWSVLGQSFGGFCAVTY